MISNPKLKYKDNKIIFEWEWTQSDGHLNVYIQKANEENLEKLGPIIQISGLADGQKIYEFKERGFFKIVAFPVEAGEENRDKKIETSYEFIGTKTVLEYSIEEYNDFSCRVLHIKKVDKPLKKDFVYLKSVSDDIKIPLTSNITSGQKFLIASRANLKLFVEHPYCLEIDVKEII